MRRVEDEAVIDEAEYRALLKRADPKRRPIEKERYCFTDGGLLWELDVFPFWKDRAILEVELEDETQECTIPSRVRLLWEVTGDKRYTNASLSREIPYDALDPGTNSESARLEL